MCSSDLTASTLTVASIQMVSAPDVPSNLATAARLVAQAADAGAQLVVLPEYFALMGMNDTDKVAVREAWGRAQLMRRAAFAAFAELVEHQGIWLDAGAPAVFVGDLTHCPIQIPRPGDACAFDVNAEEAVVTRKRIFTEASRRRAAVVPAHYPGAGGATLVARGDRFEVDDWLDLPPI